MTLEREPHTQDPDYWPAKRRRAEHRVRMAVKQMSRMITPGGNAKPSPEYADAFRELMAASTGYQSVLYATRASTGTVRDEAADP